MSLIMVFPLEQPGVKNLDEGHDQNTAGFKLTTFSIQIFNKSATTY